MLSTVKNTAVDTVFPIWPIVELPNLLPTRLIEYQNVKTEKTKKNKHKNNAVLKENETKRH